MIKRELLVFAISFIFLIGFSSAITVDAQDKGSVIIKELGNPAVFNFHVSSGIADTYEIYSFLGVSFSPRGTFDLPKGTSNVEIKVYPSKEVLDLSGFYNFEYQLKGQQSGIYSDKLQIKLVTMSQTLDITAEPLEVDDSVAKVTLTNSQNTMLEDVKVSLNSPLFTYSEVVTLMPYASVVLDVPIDKNKQRGLKAGQYIISAEVSLQGTKSDIDGTIEYLEQENIQTKTDSNGFLVRDTTITKSNEGNVQSMATITAKRDALSRLFTTFSAEPLTSQRKGFIVSYSWESSLAPGQETSVTVTTNYTLPFIILVLIIAVVVLVRRTTNASIKVNKTVSFVRTKGGEFALKVTLSVNSDSNVENVQLIDSVPAVMKLYHKYGRAPDRVDAQTRRLFWNIDRLSAGESRVFSYIIYSNIKIMGRFELPAAVAVFEQDGQTHEVYSPRAFFVTGTARGEGI